MILHQSGKKNNVQDKLMPYHAASIEPEPEQFLEDEVH